MSKITSKIKIVNKNDQDISPATSEGQAYDSVNRKVVVGNSKSKFRDGLADASVVQPDATAWDIVADNGHNTFIRQSGNSSASSYLEISPSPFVRSKKYSIVTKQTFQVPFRLGFGVSMSQRFRGEEFGIEEIGVDANSAVEVITPTATKPITGATASVTSNVATFTLANHGLNGADRVIISGCAEPALNVGPAYVTIVNVDTFTVPVTIANASYSTVGGNVDILDPLDNAKNGSGYNFEQTTASQATLHLRRNGSKPRLSTNANVGTTTASQTNANPFTDAFNSASQYELWLTMEELLFRSYASDSLGGMHTFTKYSQGLPDEGNYQKIRVRVNNLSNKGIPVAEIATIAKTGTTTATVTTVAPHGLTTASRVQIWGVRDQTNFPNLTARTAVASIISATQFTIVIGTASTTNSEGGAIYDIQGDDQTMPVYAQSIQSVAHSTVTGVTTLIGSGTWATPLNGELVEVYGLSAGLNAYEGTYKVARVSTTTLELIRVDGTSNGSLTTTNCGGAVIKRTSFRLHYVRMLDHTRHFVEVIGGRGNQNSDVNNAVPVVLTSSASVSQTTGVNTTAWNASGWGGFLVNDVVSAAITTTTTTSAITPASVANIGTYAHSFNIVVTAVSGTTPTLDLAVEESIDNGTNWRRIYEFPRITATGNYSSPLIRSQYGTRFRYVQTIAGTTPSFTRAINRVQFSSNAPFFRQFVDRTIVPDTLNSTTPITGSFLNGYDVQGSETLNLIVNMGAIITTAPQFVVEGSEDGTNWYQISATPLTAVASSTVIQTISGYIPMFARVRVSTAGVGATLGYVSLKAIGK